MDSTCVQCHLVDLGTPNKPTLALQMGHTAVPTTHMSLQEKKCHPHCPLEYCCHPKFHGCSSSVGGQHSEGGDLSKAAAPAPAADHSASPSGAGRSQIRLHPHATVGCTNDNCQDKWLGAVHKASAERPRGLCTHFLRAK